MPLALSTMWARTVPPLPREGAARVQLTWSWQVFAFLGFLSSAMWINAAATELVNILRTLGIIFELSNTVLGLTLLAWGNSIGGKGPVLSAFGAYRTSVGCRHPQHLLFLPCRHLL